MATKTTSYFGAALRDARKAKNMTLGDVADAIGVSAAFLSDIERGNRQPLTSEKIRVVATVLDADYRDLVEAAAKDRKEFRIPTEGLSDAKVAAGALMLRGLHDLDEDQLKEVVQALESQLSQVRR